VVERVVHAGQTDRHWDFSALGEPLLEEDLAGYGARRKRDRLNEERLSALLCRLGATPWLEQFYALPHTRVFVLCRESAPRQLSGGQGRTCFGWANQPRQPVPGRRLALWAPPPGVAALIVKPYAQIVCDYLGLRGGHRLGRGARH
jgi:hypothetical protein